MKAKKQEPSLPLPAIITIVAGTVLVGAGYLFVSKDSPQPQQAALTAEAKGYVRNLKLADVEYKATAAYLGGELIEVLGKITNAGDRELQRVELNCVFYDSIGQVVRRARVPIVKSLLKPGELRAFRLPFDDIPQSWNRTPPQMVIAHITF
jgi:hypothetical protein